MIASDPDGLLLTGGASSRMGRDKAGVEVGGVGLARRTAGILAAATATAVEVGPGCSGLPSVAEEPPGSGPLAAVVAGWHQLVRVTGEKRPVLVLACDLPELTVEVAAWLAAYPGAGSVVPTVAGVPQPLCARWSVADLERAAAQLAAGERSLRRVFGADATFAGEAEWGAVARPGSFEDVDTPDDLARRGLAPPPSGDQWVALSRSPLPVAMAGEWVVLPGCGAVVGFAGTVRDHADGRSGVEELTYEAYEAPALARMGALADGVRRRTEGLGRVAVLHRLGRLSVGEVAVAVAVSAAHRQEAFEAGRFLIDAVKETVPIWKYERWSAGEGWGTRSHPVSDL